MQKSDSRTPGFSIRMTDEERKAMSEKVKDANRRSSGGQGRR